MLNSLVLFALSVSLVFADNNTNKDTFILDFLKSQTQPTNLVVWRNCFDERQKVDLLGKSSFTSTVFSQQDSLNESDFRENPQYCLFILDLTCFVAPERIILKVNSRFHYCFCNNHSFSFLSSSYTHQIDTRLIAHPYRWIMFVEDDKVLNNVRALPDSDVLIAQATNDGFALKQLYRTDESSDETHYENYGLWSEQSGIVDERSSKIISRRRANLGGKLITSSYVALNKNSRNHLTDFVDKNVDSILKLNYIIVNTVLDKLNATKRDLFQGTWGYYNAKTRKWSGMVGDIIDKGADIGGVKSEDNG